MFKNFNADLISEAIEILKTGEYIDDHDGGLYNLQNVVGIQINGSRQYVVHLFERGTEYFCVNKMYVEDGMPHLSMDSTGGCIKLVEYGNLNDAVRAYQKEHTRDEKGYGSDELIIILRKKDNDQITIDIL